MSFWLINSIYKHDKVHVHQGKKKKLSLVQFQIRFGWRKRLPDGPLQCYSSQRRFYCGGQWRSLEGVQRSRFCRECASIPFSSPSEPFQGVGAAVKHPKKLSGLPPPLTTLPPLQNSCRADSVEDNLGSDATSVVATTFQQYCWALMNLKAMLHLDL